jgi:hypothetical protein
MTFSLLAPQRREASGPSSAAAIISIRFVPRLVAPGLLIASISLL